MYITDSLFLKFYLSMLYAATQVPEHACGGQRTTFGSSFSPFTLLCEAESLTLHCTPGWLASPQSASAPHLLGVQGLDV